MIRDIHTHHLPVHPDEAIISYYCSSHSLTDMDRAVHLSAGIHPWFLTEEDITLQLAWLDTLLEDKRLLAIGEAGLDKCCHTPFALQQKAFEAQIICSEHRDLPMILHIVRAYQELSLPTLDYPRIPRKERSCQKPPRPRLLPLLRTEIPTGNPPLRTRRPSPAGDRRIFATYP